MLNPLPTNLHLRSGDPATASVVMAARPSAGDTVTIAGTVFTYGTDWNATIKEIAHDQGLGQYSPAISAVRLSQAINADFANQSEHISTQPVQQFWAIPYGPTVRLVATQPGVAGNSLTLSTSNSTAFTVSGSTFSGGTLGVDGSVVPALGVDAGVVLVSTTAYAASKILKATPGTLISLEGYNSNSSAQFIQVHDSATLPADAAVPKYTFSVDGTRNFSLTIPTTGAPFLVGIVVCNSATGPTKTIGSADCWFTGVVK